VTPLVVEGMRVELDSAVVVDGLSLEVGEGEWVGIIGPNGAGKTTFFNLISGLFPPTHGAIFFDGRDITRLSANKRVSLGITRTFQVTEIFPELTVSENLRIAVESAAGLRLSPWAPRGTRREIANRVVELLTAGGLIGKGQRLVGELSHGDQRATEIMMALALKPRLLLLDEPTAGMGEQETREVVRLIRRLHRDERLTIVLIEHDMRVIFHLADRITVLAEGSVLADGAPDAIAANERVQAAYLGSTH